MTRAQGTSRTLKPPAGRPGLAHPLESLAFVAPLILVYQFGAWYLQPELGERATDRVVAFQLLRVFFELFGSLGQWMPALAVVAVLLGAQVFSHRPWKIRPRAVLLFYVESVAWAAPLLLLSRTLLQAGMAGRGLGQELVLCVGAGIYEELVFRLVLICVVVMVGHDLLGGSAAWSLVAAIVLSAVLFAAHHHPPFGSEVFESTRFIFRLMAGLYLGAVFAYRGYGPAAGTHVAYNVVVIAFMRA